MVPHDSKNDLSLEQMHKKFEINRTEIKCGCQSGRKLVTHNCKSDLPLTDVRIYPNYVSVYYSVGLLLILEIGHN